MSARRRAAQLVPQRVREGRQPVDEGARACRRFLTIGTIGAIHPIGQRAGLPRQRARRIQQAAHSPRASQ